MIVARLAGGNSWVVLDDISLSALLDQSPFILVDIRSEGLSNFALLSNFPALLRSVRQLLRSVRQLSFFSTTAENETFSRQMKQVFTSVPSLGLTFLGRGNIYSLWLTTVRE